MSLCKIDPQLFLLQHHQPDRFHRSVWDGSGAPSLWYVAYRILIALFMLVGVLCHFASTLDTLGIKWFIYMTNQGISLLVLHYLVYAGVVVGRRLGAPHPLPSLPTAYKVSWGLQSCFSTVALWITLVYWIALHPYVVEFDLIQGEWMIALNYFLHLVNTLSCLLDIFLTARPIRVHHFYLAVIFGIWYTFFSLIYWAAGGTGICRDRCDLDPSCPFVCDSYIYPILDWDAHPGMAAGVVLGGCVLMPVFQAVWCGLAWVRDFFKERLCS